MGGEEGRTCEKDNVVLLVYYQEARAGGSVPVCDEARQYCCIERFDTKQICAELEKLVFLGALWISQLPVGDCVSYVCMSFASPIFLSCRPCTYPLPFVFSLTVQLRDDFILVISVHKQQAYSYSFFFFQYLHGIGLVSALAAVTKYHKLGGLKN